MARKLNIFRSVRLLTFIALLILLWVTKTRWYMTRDVDKPKGNKGLPFQNSIMNSNTDTEKHDVEYIYKQSNSHKTHSITSTNKLEEAHVEEKRIMTRERSTTNEEILKTEYKATLDDVFDEDSACSPKTSWYRLLPTPSVSTDFSSRDFTERAVCQYENMLNVSKNASRLTLMIQCENGDTRFDRSCVRLNKMDEHKSPQTITVPIGDPYLLKFIESCCYDSLRIPNIVHYVRYNRSELKFVEMVSFISVIRFVNPCAILIHGDILPTGKYWNYVRAIFPNIIHVKREPPKTVFGRKLGYKEHSGDIMRLEILLEYGGIYVDTDSVFFKPIDKFRSYPCTLASQLNISILCGFIFAEKNARFIQKWLDGYRVDYRNNSYAYNCMIYPKKLLLNYSSYVHIEDRTLSRVNENEFGNAVYRQNHNWKDRYALHLYDRIYGGKLDEDFVKTFNTTVGSICRHVLYGNNILCRP